jgi:hypothetical protein
MKVFSCLALISPSLLRWRLSRVALLILPSIVHAKCTTKVSTGYPDTGQLRGGST